MTRLKDFRRQEVGVFKAEGAENPDYSAWVAIASALLNLDEFITKE